MSIFIESERLVLREFTESDLPALVDIASQEHILYWCSDWEDCKSWVNDWFKGIEWRYSFGDPNVEFILLAIIEKQTNKLIGQINTGCELKEEKPGELSIGYFISKEAMNKGYATEAAKAMTQYYFPINKNGFFYAIIKLDNAASARVATKAGFKFVSELKIIEKVSKQEMLFHYYRLYNPCCILNIHEHPDYLDRAVDYFSSKWGIDRQIYHDSISESITTNNPLPRWYLMLDGDRIIGSFGLIENDFMVRKDLKPWLCALYVEESKRCKGLGGKLLAHGRSESVKLGFNKLYLCTDHVGYYEKYGWQFFGMEESEFGGKTRVYEIECEE